MKSQTGCTLKLSSTSEIFFFTKTNFWTRGQKETYFDTSGKFCPFEGIEFEYWRLKPESDQKSDAIFAFSNRKTPILILCSMLTGPLERGKEIWNQIRVRLKIRYNIKNQWPKKSLFRYFVPCLTFYDYKFAGILKFSHLGRRRFFPSKINQTPSHSKIFVCPALIRYRIQK